MALARNAFFCIITFNACVSTTACASELTQRIVAGAKVERIDTATIRIDGILGIHTAQKFKELISPDIKTVVISSPGGWTRAGMEIANAIRAAALDVVVEGVCASSCANYIFVSGKKKTLRMGSVLGFHGGHSHSPFGTIEDSTARRIEGWKEELRMEQELYVRLKVSLDLIIYSGWLTTGDDKGRTFTEWFPPLSALQRAGVTGIVEYNHIEDDEKASQAMLNLGYKNRKVSTSDTYGAEPHVLRAKN